MVETARIAVKSVQKAADKASEPRPRRRSNARRVPVKTTKKVKVDQRVWSTALLLAGGNGRRIRVVNETEVVVENGDGR